MSKSIKKQDRLNQQIVDELIEDDLADAKAECLKQAKRQGEINRAMRFFLSLNDE